MTDPLLVDWAAKRASVDADPDAVRQIARYEIACGCLPQAALALAAGNEPLARDVRTIALAALPAVALDEIADDLCADASSPEDRGALASVLVDRLTRDTAEAPPGPFDPGPSLRAIARAAVAGGRDGLILTGAAAGDLERLGRGLAVSPVEGGNAEHTLRAAARLWPTGHELPDPTDTSPATAEGAAAFAPILADVAPDQAIALSLFAIDPAGQPPHEPEGLLAHVLERIACKAPGPLDAASLDRAATALADRVERREPSMDLAIGALASAETRATGTPSRARDVAAALARACERSVSATIIAVAGTLSSAPVHEESPLRETLTHTRLAAARALVSLIDTQREDPGAEAAADLADLVRHLAIRRIWATGARPTPCDPARTATTEPGGAIVELALAIGERWRSAPNPDACLTLLAWTGVWTRGPSTAWTVLANALLAEPERAHAWLYILSGAPLVVRRHLARAFERAVRSRPGDAPGRMAARLRAHRIPARHPFERDACLRRTLASGGASAAKVAAVLRPGTDPGPVEPNDA